MLHYCCPRCVTAARQGGFFVAGYVSDSVVRRLPAYYRNLTELNKEGVEQISSRELGKRMSLTPSQIRQDINTFGSFGRQGLGYNVLSLRAHIGHTLGIDRPHAMLIVGAGNIGRAVALSDSFSNSGFRTVAIFDNAGEKIGGTVGACVVRDLEDMDGYLADTKVDVGVIAVPFSCAQEVADRLYRCGVRAIWNFAPIDLKHPAEVALVNVHLEESLALLSYRMLDKAKRSSGEETDGR